MKQFLDRIDFAKFDCKYADVRIEQEWKSEVVFRNFELESAQDSPSIGAFIRVFNYGKWFYAATTELGEIVEAIESLISDSQEFRSDKNPERPKREIKNYHKMMYEECAAHKFSIQEKTEFMESLHEILKEFPEVTNPQAQYKDLYKIKWFKSSDGVEFQYDYNHAGTGIRYTVIRGEDRFDDVVQGFFKNIGLEIEKEKNELRKQIEKSLTFLDAKPVKAGAYKVILSPKITGVFTHESFGHKSEADFMLGDEAAKKEWQIGKEVAAPSVSIVDDGDAPYTSGYCPIDDEGNIKQKTYLIKDGKLAGRLHSWDTSLAMDEKINGSARAMNFEFEPIVRMSNTYIEKGDLSFDDLISGVDEGVFIESFLHGMGMSTFTIAPIRSYMIRKGKISEPVKVSVISGSVFETLKRIEGIGSDFEVHSSAIGGCGKMEQMPLPVADGGPSILVSSMQVS